LTASAPQAGFETRKRRSEGKETSMTRVALLERLKELQQMPKFQNRDIRTISAVLTIEALAKHVAVCEQAAGVEHRQSA